MTSVVSLFYAIRACIGRLRHPRRIGARFIVLLGGPGAGKGTLAAKLAALYRMPHLNMGNILRREIAEGTEIGLEWGPAIKAGKLVPDSVIQGLLHTELAKPEYDRGAVLDGIPRTKPQAKALRWLLTGFGCDVEAAVFLDVSREDLQERLALRRTCTNSACARSYHLKFLPPKEEGKCDLCGSSLKQRDDETSEAINTRFDEFNRTFAPLKAYYRKTKRLKVVRSTNAAGPDKVFDEVAFILAENAQ